MSQRKPLTLSALITLNIGGGLLLLSLILGVVVQQGISRVLDNAQYAKADALARQLAIVSLDAIMIYDYGTLERYVRDLSAQPDVLYLQIRRKDGELLAEAGDNPEQSNAKNSLTLTRPVQLGDNKLGYITVSYDRSLANKTILMLTAGGLLGILALVLILYFFMKRLLEQQLIRPVQLLAEQATPLHRDDVLDTSHLPTELVQVANTFTTFCRELKDYSSENERIQKMARHATERLCQAKQLATVGQIAAELAHSLNTPLGNIIGYAQQAQQQSDDEAMLQRLAVIESQARTCSQVVRNLLTASRPPEANSRPIDLQGQVNAIIDMIRPVLQDRNTHIHVAPHASNLLVWADPSCIDQVLFNLLSNAAEAGAGQVEIEMMREDDKVLLKITDDGAGIDECLKPRLFEAFVSGKPAGEGTGLGLHICKTLLQSVGADIELTESQPGKTVFSIRWRQVESES